MRVLVIVPPFGSIERPNLGVHTLQVCARAHGHEVDILYSNLAFAARIGEIPYMTITTYNTHVMIGERIMGFRAGALLTEPMLDELNQEIKQAAQIRGVNAVAYTLDSLDASIKAWLAEMTEIATSRPYDVIGFSSTFEQTNGLALLAKHCRAALPDVTLVAGGANCEGEMAQGMIQYVPELDVIFSGESEHAFTSFLDDPASFAGQKIIHSQPNSDISNIPLVEYSEFFAQLDHWLPGSSIRQHGELTLAYESSRGCWWGQKNHCTFCGLNGNGMGYRQKSPEQVLSEMTQLAEATGIRRFGMTDNIMPVTYYTTLLPALAKADLGLDIFYEQKANISLDKVLALKAAGVNGIQPGIESLQDDLLRLMKKGTSTKQNIALLRYARSAGVTAKWNILSGFPGSREEWYEEMLRLVPLLVHLEPPTGVARLNVDRFSPYFDRASDYGITNLRPLPSYREIFPRSDDLNKLAYHFIGDSDGYTVDNSETVRQLRAAVNQWRGLWEFTQEEATRPCLEVVEIDAANYLLIDSRPLPDTLFMQQISADQASVALSFHNEESALTSWGEERRVCVKARNGFIPLACATPEILQRFEKVRAPDLQDAAV